NGRGMAIEFRVVGREGDSKVVPPIDSGVVYNRAIEQRRLQEPAELRHGRVACAQSNSTLFRMEKETWSGSLRLRWRKFAARFIDHKHKGRHHAFVLMRRQLEAVCEQLADHALQLLKAWRAFLFDGGCDIVPFVI